MPVDSYPPEVRSVPEALRSATVMTVKIGSALIVGDDGSIRQDWLDALFGDLAAWSRRGVQICLVASGAMAAGGALSPSMKRCGWDAVAKRQAAALGQVALSSAFLNAALRVGRQPALILVGREDFDEAQRATALRGVIERCWRDGMFPILNQNDATVTDATRFRDNDHLAAEVSRLLAADVALLLTSVDGLYRNFNTPGATPIRIERILPIDNGFHGLVDDGRLSETSGGGMAGKLKSAIEVATSGATAIISDGTQTPPISRLLAGDAGTLVAPRPVSRRLSA